MTNPSDPEVERVARAIDPEVFETDGDTITEAAYWIARRNRAKDRARAAIAAMQDSSLRADDGAAHPSPPETTGADSFLTLVPKSALAAANHLSAAFVFSESRYGHEYWHTVYQRLLEISRTPKSPYQIAREASDKRDGCGATAGSEPVPQSDSRLDAHREARMASVRPFMNLPSQPKQIEPKPNFLARIRSWLGI